MYKSGASSQVNRQDEKFTEQTSQRWLQAPRHNAADPTLTRVLVVNPTEGKAGPGAETSAEPRPRREPAAEVVAVAVSVASFVSYFEAMLP